MLAESFYYGLFDTISFSGFVIRDYFKEKALNVFNAIFNDKDKVNIDGTTFHLEYTGVHGLRMFSTVRYDYVEQNPDKNSYWARKARMGHQIMWVMDCGKYIAQVFDGEFLDLRR